MKDIGILVFCGTQCDRDTKKALSLLKRKSQYLWHQDHFNYRDFESFIVPGGFSYGDYLRAGALAARSSAIKNLIQASQKGYPILGICNGFQILCEAGLLPGALTPNTQLQFLDCWVDLEWESEDSFWNPDQLKTTVLPIAHAEGRYFASQQVLDDLEQNRQIWLRYKKNPNGSARQIAGVLNRKKNVAGLMPHPERAVAHWMGSSDGLYFLRNL